MKNLIYVFVAGIFIILQSCTDNDDVNGKVDLLKETTITSDGSEAEDLILDVYNKYELEFKYKFEEEEYKWDWISDQVKTITYADKNYIVDFINTIVSDVFAKFPEEFVKKYFIRKVLIVDSLYLGGIEKEIEFYDEGASYLLLANVSDRFSQVYNDALKEQYLSLFIERMIKNQSFPSEFAFFSMMGYEELAVDEEELKKYGFFRADWRTGTKPPTIYQDFADYVAFLVCRSKEDKQSLYDESLLVFTKAQEVTKYLKENFKIDILDAE